MNKRGLSTVVTTLIIILLVLVAIGIVWVVIRNVITEGAEEISLGKLTIDLQIKNVNIERGNPISVKIKRNPGKGDLSGIKFLVSDGVQTQEFDEPTTMGELAEQTFTLNYSGLVKEISIAPILKSESGKEFIGNEIDKINEKKSKELSEENQWWTKDPEKINILIIENKEETAWVNKMTDLGYNVEINGGINSKEELDNYISTLEEDKKPDIIACIRPYWSCSKYVLFNLLYDSNYSIFTEGNDNSVIYPILTSESTTILAGTILPTDKGCAEPLIYGWDTASNSGVDVRRGILSISSEACSIAEDNTLNYIEAIYLEESGKGRWYHHQPSSIAPEELINNAMKYLSR